MDILYDTIRQRTHSSSLHIQSIFLLFVFVIVILNGACGTIMHGSTQLVAISSNPSDATVFVNDNNKGTTPLTINLKRENKSMNLRLVLDGYLPYETTINRKISGWVWGNIVFGALPGVIVDAISGGLYKLTPEQIKGDLKDNSVTVTSAENQFFIAVVLNPKPGWKKIGQLKPVQ